MVRNFGIFLNVVLLCAFSFTKAQIKPGDFVDGITAVIGDEIVLESELQEQINYSKQQGGKVDDVCEFLRTLVNNKLMIYKAKKDTLIEKRADAIREMVNQKYDQILSQFPDEKQMLKVYNFRTSYEMKKAIEKIDTDNYYGQEKFSRITGNVDVTPNEVKDFYNQYKDQLPDAKDEVILARIQIYPKLKEKHKQELIDKLNRIKERIEKEGESFENMARIYSEDPGSASNGGLYKNISKGKMVKPFEAAALNLQEGEISEPVESDYGFHLIQLVKKSGKEYDARHILLLSKPDREEVLTAKKELDSIRTLIIGGKMTFKEAAYRFSDDKATKFNAGVLSSPAGGNKLEKASLPAIVAYQIAGHKKGDIVEVFEEENNNKKTLNIIKIIDDIPSHKLNLVTDYEKIKTLALNKKKSEVMDRWVKEELPKTFLSANKRYEKCNIQK